MEYENEEDDDEHKLLDDLVSNGQEACWQDWDSGGLGEGAGRVTVYRFRDVYYALRSSPSGFAVG